MRAGSAAKTAAGGDEVGGDVGRDWQRLNARLFWGILQTNVPGSKRSPAGNTYCQTMNPEPASLEDALRPVVKRIIESTLGGAQTIPPDAIEKISARIAAILRQLTEVSKETAAQSAGPYRDHEGVAAYMQCSVLHVNSLIAGGRLRPDRYDGSTPLFAVKSIEAYLLRSTVEQQERLRQRRKIGI